MKLDPTMIGTSMSSADVEITPRDSGWFWISESVEHGPFTQDELNEELARLETLCLVETAGKRHGAVIVKTPSGRTWVIDCRRQSPKDFERLNRRS